MDRSNKKVRSVDMNVDPASGRITSKDKQPPEALSKAQEALNELGQSYDSLYGRESLEQVASQGLWAYFSGKKITALQIFQKASWWKVVEKSSNTHTQIQAKDAPILLR